MMLIRSLYWVLVLVSYTALAQTPVVFIDPRLGPNPILRDGYTLVMHDEFDEPIVSEQLWNREAPYDCYPSGLQCLEIPLCNACFQDPAMCRNPLPLPSFEYSRTHASPNPKNVVRALVDSISAMQLTFRDEAYNGNQLSSASVKTFDEALASTFRGFAIYPNSYIEIRAQYPDYQDNVGSAAWLYRWGMQSNEYREIDLWEVKDNRDGGGPNIFTTSYHYSTGNGNKTVSAKVRVFEQSTLFRRVKLSDQFLVWGIDWTDQAMRFYLNNELYWEIDFKKDVLPNKYMLPAPLIFGMGNNMSQGLPPQGQLGQSGQSLLVDYIRVYKRADSTFTKKLEDKTVFCQDENYGCNPLKINYLPNVTYKWQSDYFTFKSYEGAIDPTTGLAYLQECLCEMQWACPKSNTIINQSYPITVTATFEGDDTAAPFSEIVRWDIKLLNCTKTKD